jgi:hypothetical protein
MLNIDPDAKPSCLANYLEPSSTVMLSYMLKKVFESWLAWMLLLDTRFLMNQCTMLFNC